MLYTVDSFRPAAGDPDHVDHVVLLDARGKPSATMAKSGAHHGSTPFHLAFSCHVVRADGRALITRRSACKQTWPGVWSNACCGHPRLGETLRGAVRRHLAAELGVGLRRLALAIGDFAYRAEMPDGIVEHELCPVVVAEVDGPLRLDPAEADRAEWVEWSALQRRARDAPGSLSPWVVAQLARLPASAADVVDLLERAGHADHGLLDAPIEIAARPPAAARPCVGLDRVLASVDGVLDAFLADRRRDLVAIDPAAADLGRAVHELATGGGKRLRPAFVHCGWWAARSAVEGGLEGPVDGAVPSGSPPDRVALAVVTGRDGPGGRGGQGEHAAHLLGATMELLHAFALLHDDVMDRAAVRRGRPAAHVTFTSAHRDRRGWGDAERFGANAAVLAGDLAFVWADELLDGVAASPDCLRAVRAVFGRLRDEVIAGQYLDLLAASTPLGEGSGAGEETALAVARLKSARYTVTRPLELGAALGGPLGAGSPTLGALRAYGDAIGCAFQMRDDVLDLFGDPATTGKGTLADLREGKRTLLLERALRLAAPADVDHLVRSVGGPDLSDADAARCRDIVAGSGALASVEALIADQHRSAMHALEGIDGPVRDVLVELARLAVDREA